LKTFGIVHEPVLSEVQDSLLCATYGGKGAGLLKMWEAGLPVPPGAILTTMECMIYEMPSTDKQDHISKLTEEALEFVTVTLKEKFGYIPLVSVRSGAPVSMPGMMDTILNVGLNSKNLAEWKKRIGSGCAIDCMKRLDEMYAKTVDKDAVASKLDLKTQLHGSIQAVFDSWKSERAVEYRKLNNISSSIGTAVVIQAMVFGNYSDKSCSGVLFTRDPQTGVKGIVGEYLPNAQGEDVVSGKFDVLPLSTITDWNQQAGSTLNSIALELEQKYKDAQDIEFTIQDGEVFILQTRAMKRSAPAAFKIAYDMVQEGLIDKTIALKRVTGQQYMLLSRPVIDSKFKMNESFKGLSASSGIVTGAAVFTSADAKAHKGPCILIRPETVPEDFPGMAASVGIITATGGNTSHAAVVARGMDKPCIVGCTSMIVGENQAVIKNAGTNESFGIKAGDKITMDGATGRVWVNVDVPVIGGSIQSHVKEMLCWGAEETNVMVQFDVKETGNNVNRLPNEGYIAVNVSALKSMIAMGFVLKALAERPNLRGLLTFDPVTTKSDHDKDYVSIMFGEALAAKPVNKETIVIVQKAFRYSHYTKAFKDRWVLHLPADKQMIGEVLRNDFGWKVAHRAQTLKQLMKADGLVQISPELFALLDAQGVTAAEFVALLNKTGRNIKDMPKVLENDHVVFEVFGT
jgi:phosphoenolpyruvate synthase/pyruvate phosphate dikinase